MYFYSNGAKVAVNANKEVRPLKIKVDVYYNQSCDWERMICMKSKVNEAMLAEIRTIVKEEVKEEVKDIRADVAVLKTDVSELKTDVSELKTDVAELKTNVSGLNIDNRSIRTELKDLRDFSVEFRNDTFKHFDRIYNLLDTFKTEYYAITSGIRRIEDEHKIIDHRTIFNEIQALKNRN